MRRFPHIVICSAVFASLALPALAEDALVTADHLGEMIAAEKTCDLDYDAAAVQRWVEKHVPEADFEFTSNLNALIAHSGREQSEMSPTAKIAFCAQARRSAKANGFTN